MPDLDRPTGGRVVAIHVSRAAGAPMEPRTRVRARSGGGIEGDRYDAGTGHWSPIHRAGDGLTLVDAAVIDELVRDAGLALGPADTRRNVTTSGIDLDGLIGSTFRIGSATLRAVRRCEPCSYLDGLLDRPVLVWLVHRGGIRVEVVEGGEFGVGDPIEVIAR
jgi:MOSC domain-containing protein YiiM